jgi:hypothetical protein
MPLTQQLSKHLGVVRWNARLWSATDFDIINGDCGVFVGLSQQALQPDQ